MMPLAHAPHEIYHPAVRLVDFPLVETDVYGCHLGAYAMPQGLADGLFRDIQPGGYRGPRVARPIGGYIREQRLTYLPAPSPNPLDGSYLFQGDTHTVKEILVVAVLVHDVQQVSIAPVPLDDLHRLRLHLDGVQFPGLRPLVLEPAVHDGVRLCHEQIHRVHADKIKHQHEHIPVSPLVILAWIVPQQPELLDRKRPLARLLLFYLELPEWIEGRVLVIDGEIEHGTDVPKVYGVGVDLHPRVGHPSLEVFQPSLVHGLERAILVEGQDLVPCGVIACPCPLSLLRRDELIQVADEIPAPRHTAPSREQDGSQMVLEGLIAHPRQATGRLEDDHLVHQGGKHIPQGGVLRPEIRFPLVVFPVREILLHGGIIRRYQYLPTVPYIQLDGEGAVVLPPPLVQYYLLLRHIRGVFALYSR